jgi:hypothetical protein
VSPWDGSQDSDDDLQRSESSNRPRSWVGLAIYGMLCVFDSVVVRARLHQESEWAFDDGHPHAEGPDVNPCECSLCLMMFPDPEANPPLVFERAIKP